MVDNIDMLGFWTLEALDTGHCTPDAGHWTLSLIKVNRSVIGAKHSLQDVNSWQ